MPDVWKSMVVTVLPRNLRRPRNVVNILYSEMVIHKALKKSTILQGSDLGYFSEALSTLHLCLLLPNPFSQSIYLIHSYFLKTPYFMGLNKMVLFPQYTEDNSCCPFPFSRIEYFKITATRTSNHYPHWF